MGWRSPFFFGATTFAEFCPMTTNLAELLERTLPPLGYELVDCEDENACPFIVIV